MIRKNKNPRQLSTLVHYCCNWGKGIIYVVDDNNDYDQDHHPHDNDHDQGDHYYEDDNNFWIVVIWNLCLFVQVKNTGHKNKITQIQINGIGNMINAMSIIISIDNYDWMKKIMAPIFTVMNTWEDYDNGDY